jgi:hypothetical protein
VEVEIVNDKLLKPSEIYCGNMLMGSEFGRSELERAACIIIANCAPYGDKWQQVPLSGQALWEYESEWVRRGYLKYIGEAVVEGKNKFIFEPTLRFVLAVSQFPATAEQIEGKGNTYTFIGINLHYAII